MVQKMLLDYLMPKYLEKKKIKKYYGKRKKNEFI